MGVSLAGRRHCTSGPGREPIANPPSKCYIPARVEAPRVEPRHAKLPSTGTGTRSRSKRSAAGGSSCCSWSPPARATSASAPGSATPSSARRRPLSTTPACSSSACAASVASPASRPSTTRPGPASRRRALCTRGPTTRSRCRRPSAAARCCAPSSTPRATRRDGGEAQFIAVQGGVEYRRGDRGDWEQARGRVTLRPGDYVKTGANGSAEIMFVDGTLYTVRSDTLFLVSSRAAGEQGKTGAACSTAGSTSTPRRAAAGWRRRRREARGRRPSEAVVSYDESKRERALLRLPRQLEVKTGGRRRGRSAALRVGAAAGRQAVGGRDAAGRRPGSPGRRRTPISTTTGVKQMRLVVGGGAGWRALRLAGLAQPALRRQRHRRRRPPRHRRHPRPPGRGHLPVARRRGRPPARARPVERAAAASASSPAARAPASRATSTPPELEVQSTCRPTAAFSSSAAAPSRAPTVTVNGESVAVQADGTFTKTIQLAASRAGAFLDVKAVDASGNEATRRARVFVESL